MFNSAHTNGAGQCKLIQHYWQFPTKYMEEYINWLDNAQIHMLQLHISTIKIVVGLMPRNISRVSLQDKNWSSDKFLYQYILF